MRSFLGRKLYNFPFYLLKDLAQIFGVKYDNKDELYAFFDLQVSPVTFDVLKFLCIASTICEVKGLRGFCLVIVPNTKEQYFRTNPNKSADFSEKDSIWRLHHIILKSAGLFPRCNAQIVCYSREHASAIFQEAVHVFPDRKNYSLHLPFATYHLAWPNEKARKGLEVKHAKAPAKAEEYVRQWIDNHAKGKRLISITLREYNHDATRNSRLDEWIKLVRYLESRSFSPVIIRDTAQAFEPLKELKSSLFFSEAAWNLDLRLAFYEACYLNIGNNNGVFELTIVSKLCRYILFKYNLCMAFSLDEIGIKPGDKHHLFGDKYQRLVWNEEDDFLIMKEAVDEMIALIENDIP